MRFSNFVEAMQKKALSDLQKGFIEDLEKRLKGDCEISMPKNIGRKQNAETMNAIHKMLNA